jgi:hypothetical protein
MKCAEFEAPLRHVCSVRSRRRGLTSLQTLALLAIAALTVTSLASLHASALQKGERSAEEKTNALRRIKGAAIATLMYASDYDDEFPYAASTTVARKLLAPYARTQDVFQSPTAGGSFRYNLNVGGVNASALDKPGEIPLWYEVLPGSMLPAIAYCDGHAKLVSAGARQKVQASLKRKFTRRKGARPVTGGS